MAYTTIDDPSAYFHTRLYTGNGSTQSITNNANAGDFAPDWVWIKGRSDADNNSVFDTTRGANEELVTNGTGAEATGTNLVTSFDSNGFSLGNNNGVNGSGDTYVAWQWIANGGTTSSNTDGSITSTVQANTTAGFSIVTYTGTGSNATVGHGLGTEPKVLIVKNRSTAQDWGVYHRNASSAGNDSYLELNTTDAAATAGSAWNDTTPTSSVFTVGTNVRVNTSSDNYVAYCFAEKQGYSKIGSYTGNGNADGPFIYTGFKPAFGIFKRTDTTGNWYMMTGKIGDDGQDGNPLEDRLEANTSVAEADMGQGFDFLSNGIKVRHNGAEINGSGNSFIYMAFASSPFVGSDGVPTTAR